MNICHLSMHLMTRGRLQSSSLFSLRGVQRVEEQNLFILIVVHHGLRSRLAVGLISDKM